MMRECSATITEKTQDIYDLVPGVGDLGAKIMFVTTYPSAKEEVTGVYFEGSAGKTFESFLEQYDLNMASVYITYAVKYRPYAISERSKRIVNREVTMDEVLMFSPFLLEEVAIINPKRIIALGDLAYSALMMDQEPMPAYGVFESVKIQDIFYELMVLPHPRDRKFGKVELEEDSKRRLMFTEDVPDEETKELYNAIEYPQQDEVQTFTTDVVYDRTPIPVPKRTKKTITGKHKVILVYGGTRLSDDPSYVVAERVTSVLAELNVSIHRIDLYKNNYQMESFLDQLAESDGVIIATTVEWFGIGGLLQTFLDQAYISGQFSVFEGTYLFNIAISRNRFEREAMDHILRSWEILGGIEGINLCASIESSAEIETSSDLLFSIDKKAEDFYRVINQQRMALPTSINDNKVIVRMPAPTEEGAHMVMKKVINSDKREETIDNQGSFISNYDEFIEKQQQDINDIASLFKDRLATDIGISGMGLSELFEHRFKPDKSFRDCTISWVVNDSAPDNFVMNFKGAGMKTRKGKKSDADVIISASLETTKKITERKLTIQRAFMTGEVKAKGNFTLLYKLDALFSF